jgi:rRNA maturation protein Rpf1
MSNRKFDRERVFGHLANEFEKCTTRAEHDVVMRAFLSAIHTLAGTSHWDIQGEEVDAMRNMTRIIDVFQKFREPEVNEHSKNDEVRDELARQLRNERGTDEQ